MKTRKITILFIAVLAIISLIGCQTQNKTGAWSHRSTYPKKQNHTYTMGMGKFKFDTGNHKPLRMKKVKL